MPFLRILILLFAFNGGASAQSLERAVQQFDEGNARYRLGDYRGALESYDSAENAGFVSGALYFNMGNAYFRLDEIGESVRYYEKAVDLLPDTPELEHNLAIVRASTADQLSRLPEPFWQSAWRGVAEFFGAAPLLFIGLALYLTAATALGWRIWSGPSAWLRRILSASAVLGLGFLAAGFAASVEETESSRAVVLMDEVALLERPDGTPSDREIHEGLVVHIMQRRDGWMEVRLPNGATGWIRSEAVGVI